MTPKEILLFIITTFFISMSAVTAFGDSVVIQHEAAVQNDQGAAVEKATNSKTTLGPRQIRIKADSAQKINALKNKENMQKYKMPADGEGERKVK